MMQNNHSSYINVYTRNTPEPVYSYRSGLTVYEERLSDGMLIPGGWNAAGYPLNVLSNLPTFVSDHQYPSSFHVAIDGESVEYRLELQDFAVLDRENGSKEAVLTLRSAFKPMEIAVHTLLDGTAMFSRWLEIRNLSAETMAVSGLSLFSGIAEQTDPMKFGTSYKPEEIYTLGYFGDDSGHREGDMIWRPLLFEKTTIAGRYSRYRCRHPLFFLKNNLTGLMFFGQMAYTGGYRFSFDYDANRNGPPATLMFDLAIEGLDPLYQLEAGKTLVTPQMHIGVLFGNVDDAVNASYDHIRRSVLNLPEADGAVCPVVAGIGPEHNMEVQGTMRFMEQAAAAGAEVFYIDAGWYCPPGKEESEWWGRAGIWEADPERYPNGFREIRDYAKKLGLKFGLWMDPERIGTGIQMYFDRLDWITSEPWNKRSYGIVDFTIPEAAAWVENEIARVIEENELDFFRLDYNIAEVVTPFVKNGERQEYTLLKHYEGVYAMYERLKKRFPHVIFENCAGGGGRTDLGIMRYFHHTWVSDCQKAPRSVCITSGMTMALPPERVARLLAGMGGFRYASLDFQMRNTMLGHISMAPLKPDGVEWNTEQLDFIRHSVDVYKNFIRPFLPTAHMYHHNEAIPDAQKDGWLAMELSAADKTKEAVTIFALSKPVPVIPIRFRGVDAGKTYRVTFDNTGTSVLYTGYELKTTGLTFRLAPLTSELLLLEEVQ